MLLHLALGDAYGSGFKLCKPHIVKHENNLHYRYRRSENWPSGKGMYTDDTQMSLALAEAIVKGHPWTKESIAQRFIDVFKRDRRPGYSRKFQALLETVDTVEDFLSIIKPVKDSSGAAMRSVPMGLMNTTEEEILRRCEIQASITHDTPMGIASSQGAALMTAYFFHNLGNKYNLFGYLREHVPAIDWRFWRGPVGNNGVEVVLAAATAIIQNKTMKDVLKASVAFTGDVDTVAALAMPSAFGCNEITGRLPQRLYNGLENEKYGKDYIINLNAEILKQEWNIGAYPLCSNCRMRKHPIVKDGNGYCEECYLF